MAMIRTKKEVKKIVVFTEKNGKVINNTTIEETFTR